jgi:antitoxin component YwqK of YwqJK toxin-antitoxin module
MWKKFGLLSIILGLALVFINCENQVKVNEGVEAGDVPEEIMEPSIRPSKEQFSFDQLDNELEVVSMEDDYNNLMEYSRKKADYAKQGLFLRKDSLGRILEAAHYVNDTLHGNRIIFYPETGKRQIVENYTKGNFNGLYQMFHPNGKLEQEGHYINNVMDSIWVRYYDTGQLREEVMFRDNEENGPFKEYHLNGNIKAEGTYRDGDNEHGLLKLFDENGELVKTMNCKNGICKTIWKKEDLQ